MKRFKLALTGLLFGLVGSVSQAQSVGATEPPPVAARPAAAAPLSAQTVAVLQKRAEAGDADAQFRLGQYLEDDSRSLGPVAAATQLAVAASWYKAAADQGQGAALNNLGAMLVDGRGVPQDTQQAASYYRRGAQMGNHEAETNLALLILKKRIPGTTDEALQGLQNASAAGFAPAEAQLGQIYLAGLLVSPDDSKAAELFRQAALQHDVWGEYGYALMLQSGTGVARDLPVAGSWMEQAANAGLPVAKYDLARMLEMGLGVPADKKRADALFIQAAKLGEPRALQRLHGSTSTGPAS